MSKEWFIFQNNQQSGPFTFENLKEKVASGTLQRSDHVWCEGMNGWSRVDQIEGLTMSINKPPMPGSTHPPLPNQQTQQGGSYNQAQQIYSQTNNRGNSAFSGPSSSGGFQSAQPMHQQKSGKGLAIILIALLVFLIIGVAVVAFLILRGSGDNGGLALPGIGSSSPEQRIKGSAWQGYDDFGELIAINFDGDYMTTAILEDNGYWVNLEYRFEKINERDSVLIYDPYFEEWERAFFYEFNGDNLSIMDPDGFDDPIYLSPIDKQDFQNLISRLEEVDYFY